MRIAFVVDSFPPYISGVATHYITLAKKLLEEGHKVMIIAPNSKIHRPPKGLEKCKLVFVRSIPIGVVAKNMRLGTPSTLSTLLQLAKFKADIIEISGPTFIGIDALLASRILEIPCISYFHTLITSKDYLELITLIGKIKALEKASWIYNRWFYNASDVIFVPTKGVSRILSKNKINKKIVVAPLFTDLPESKNITEVELEQLKKNYRLKQNVALYLGRISKEKRLNELLEIWMKVVDKNHNSTLLIIGDGKYKKDLIKKIKKLKLQKYVFLTGELKHKQILESGIIKACDVYISASTSETFGIAGLEAMTNGLPVVLTKSQGLCEFVDGAGFVCKKDNTGQFAKSILRIFSNAKLKQKMSERAKLVAAKFDNDAGFKKTLQIYQEIINKYEKRIEAKPKYKFF